MKYLSQLVLRNNLTVQSIILLGLPIY